MNRFPGVSFNLFWDFVIRWALAPGNALHRVPVFLIANTHCPQVQNNQASQYRRKLCERGGEWGFGLIAESLFVAGSSHRLICAIVRWANSRVILSGDSKQHLPIERGHGLRLLEEHAGIKPWELSDIRRQEGDYKLAMQALSKGHALEGFDRLNQLRFVHQLSDEYRYVQLAKDYADARDAGKTTLVIAPNHSATGYGAIHLRVVAIPIFW